VAPSSAGRATQQEERRVEKDTSKNEPVEIVGLKNRKGKFKLGQKVKDDDDWLDGFTITVVNRTSKTISSVVIDVIFNRPENHKTSGDPPYVYTLHFSADPFFPEYQLRDKSKVIRPGEEADLVISDEDYRQNNSFLRQAGYVLGVKRLDLVIKTVGYEDGTIWQGGTMFRRDPNDPNRILEEEEQSGGGQQPAAGFLALKWSGERRRVSFVRAAWAAPAPAQTSGFTLLFKKECLRRW
jgi:hypothetical protein